MPDTKLSSLTAASALTGAEELLVNQGGVSKKVALSAINGYTDPLRSALTDPQSGFAADTVVTASRLILPQAKMVPGTFFRCRIVITKTAAGVAAPVFYVRAGVNGTTTDTAYLTYTSVAQTAVVDTGFLECIATFRSVGASTVLASWLRFDHDLAATGFANATRGFQGQTVSAAFNSTGANFGIEISMNGGASAAWTVQQCVPELLNLGD